MRERRLQILAWAGAITLVGIVFTVRLEASAAFSACEAQLELHPHGELPYRCFYEAGLQGDQREDAAARLEALAAQHPTSGWPAFYAGLADWSAPEVAEEWLAGAAERFLDAGDARGQVLALGNRENLLFALGRVEEAGHVAEVAARVGEESGEDELFLRGKIYLARHLLRSASGLERSFEILDRLSDQLSQDSPATLAQICLLNLGNVSIELGRWSRAEEAFSLLRERAVANGQAYYEAEAWYGLTRISAERLIEIPTPRHRNETVELARRTVDAARRGHHPSIEALGHWMLGVVFDAGGPTHLERCIELASTEREKGYCLNALARLLAEQDPVAARRAIEQAMALAKEAGDPWSRALSWGARMRVSWAAEPVDRAVADSWKALDTIESLRDLQDDGSEVQAGLFSTWADDYHWFGGRLLEEARETGRTDLVSEAFAVSERLRARALTDWLRATEQDSTTAALPGFASLPGIQRALRPREALLAFQVAPWEDLAGDFGGGSWLIAVTRGSAWAYPLPGRRDIRRAVDLYTGLFEGRDGAEAAPAARLYRELLAPALADLPAGVDHLILVPDDALHRLPFGALRPAPEALPLAATHRLSVAPSASLWLGWRRQGPGAEVVRASSESADRVPALVLAAPSAPRDRSGAAVAASRTPPVRALADLPPLHHARREGRAVAGALGRGTELALGVGASEALLAGADLERYGALHLAAHAVTDEDHPERSAVVLAPSSAADGTGADDGLLQAGEIASLDLGGKLVVLSSCRSAAGTVLRGEGVMSLGRAFFQAGARTVVASLWPVRDDEAAVLFESFYRHLARGESVSTALQAAQAERIAAGAPASAWAAFVVLGDGQLAPVTPPPPPSPELRFAYLAGAGGAALLLALAVVLLRRRIASALAARRPRRQRLADLASASPPTR